MQVPRSIDHVVLYSGDSDRTIWFWRDVLGCQIRNESAWREGRARVFQIVIGESQFVNVHPAGSELHPRAARPGAGTLDICLLTPVPEAELIAHLRASGIPIELGPVARSTATGAPSSSIYVRDPDGCLVELMSSS